MSGALVPASLSAVDPVTGLSPSQFDEGSFDAVVMRSVNEHFPSPRAEAERAANFLKRGGQLFVTTDNFANLDRGVFGEDWHGFDVPRNLNLFTPQTLVTSVESVGFVVRQVCYKFGSEPSIRSPDGDSPANRDPYRGTRHEPVSERVWNAEVPVQREDRRRSKARCR